MSKSNDSNKLAENIIKGSVYLAIPFLFTLLAVLFVLFYTVVQDVWYKVVKINTLDSVDATVLALKMVDIVLVVNLVLVIVIATYKRLIDRDDTGDQTGYGWIGSVTMSDMKVKLLGSVVAISAISLLADIVKMTQSESALSMENPIIIQAFVHIVLAVSAWMMAKADH